MKPMYINPLPFIRVDGIDCPPPYINPCPFIVVGKRDSLVSSE